MTDTNDPFASRPYVPPTERDGDGEPAPASTEPSAVTPPESAPERPTVEAPAAQPDARVEPGAGSDSEPTVPVAPAADTYTHRYPATDSPAADTRTDSAPPFRDHEPTIAFPAEAGAGGEPPVKKKRRGARVVASALALLILAAGAGFGGAYAYDQVQDDDSSDGSTVSSLDTGKSTNTNVPAGAVEQVAKKVLPSVVQINVKGDEESGSGTGIIISSDGEILTNNHVTAAAGDKGIITVAFNDGSNARAEVVGADPKTDLAVIKAEGKSGLTPAVLGTSSDLEVGQEVVAIGSPFGLESTVTQGIISALNRPVTSSDGSSDPTKSNTFPAIQTDAAINPGNSGGPLVDIEGNVIGINSAIRQGSGASEGGSIGLGFAIPVDLAKNVSKQLVKGETVEHAQIGVTVKPATSDDGITGVGALIDEVAGDGAGDEAGLKKGDIITAVNGDLVPSSEALVSAIRGFEPREKITVSYTRDGKKSDVEVTLDSDGGGDDN
ncbi:trypsin-like peptidase domain-containing protein [Aeromicrobium sp.]|uniref:S1C family serine protease n=1 Tax=Aeromicrobium sp. TaxID=1871063 RepID=UPI0030BB099C